MLMKFEKIVIGKTGEIKMKKILSALVISVAAVAFAFTKPKSMAVATFDINNIAVSKDDAEAVTELYIAELVSSGKVDIVDRNNFNKCSFKQETGQTVKKQ